MKCLKIEQDAEANFLRPPCYPVWQHVLANWIVVFDWLSTLRVLCDWLATLSNTIFQLDWSSCHILQPLGDVCIGQQRSNARVQKFQKWLIAISRVLLQVFLMRQISPNRSYNNGLENENDVTFSFMKVCLGYWRLQRQRLQPFGYTPDVANCRESQKCQMLLRLDALHPNPTYLAWDVHLNCLNQRWSNTQQL